MTIQIVRTWDICLDATVPGRKRLVRFTKNDDGTWSTWSQRGAMHRLWIGKHFRFVIDGDRLIPAP